MRAIWLVNQRASLIVFCVCAWVNSTFAQSPGNATENDSDNAALATQAGKILGNYCFRCHRGEGSTSGGYTFNAKVAKSLIEEGVITAGSSAKSELFDAIRDGRMPPRNQKQLPRPSFGEIETVRKWIDAGVGEFPKPERRPFITLEQQMKTIFDHFTTLDPRVRNDYRYFTLAHLHNDPDVDLRHLRMVRAGLSKALNSLSWESSLVIPEVVDREHQTVLAVDISKLGWTREHWNAVVDEYPYEVDSAGVENEQLRRIDADMTKLSGNDRMLKHIRADWFVTIGLRPKLYHQLLYDLTLPELKKRRDDPSSPNNRKTMTDADLERFLNVEVEKNIFGSRPSVQRAGYSESGISGQNRMIEWHSLAGNRSYWKSYDFLSSNARSILSEFPLGPRRSGQGKESDNEFAFEHDGGEIIFTLPNGLQGYLLASAKGVRLDAGPIEIVGDALKTSGNQLIVTGLSCIVCHRQGMVEPPNDEVRAFSSGFGEARVRIRELYPEHEVMKAKIDSNSESFITAVSRVMKEFLIAGEDSELPIEALPEPVGETARRYLMEPMNLETVACELCQPDANRLRILIESNKDARALGLGILRRDSGTIKREAWQNREGRSLMQQAADVLGYAP